MRIQLPGQREKHLSSSVQLGRYTSTLPKSITDGFTLTLYQTYPTWAKHLGLGSVPDRSPTQHTFTTPFLPVLPSSKPRASISCWVPALALYHQTTSTVHSFQCHKLEAAKTGASFFCIPYFSKKTSSTSFSPFSSPPQTPPSPIFFWNSTYLLYHHPLLAVSWCHFS